MSEVLSGSQYQRNSCQIAPPLRTHRERRLSTTTHERGTYNANTADSQITTSITLTLETAKVPRSRFRACACRQRHYNMKTVFGSLARRPLNILLHQWAPGKAPQICSSSAFFWTSSNYKLCFRQPILIPPPTAKTALAWPRFIPTTA